MDQLTPSTRPYHLFTSLVLMSNLLLLKVATGLSNRLRADFSYSFMDGPTSAHVECSPISAFCLAVPYHCLICYQWLFIALLTTGGGSKFSVITHGWTRTSAHFEYSPTSSFYLIHPCLVCC